MRNRTSSVMCLQSVPPVLPADDDEAAGPPPILAANR